LPSISIAGLYVTTGLGVILFFGIFFFSDTPGKLGTELPLDAFLARFFSKKVTEALYLLASVDLE